MTKYTIPQGQNIIKAFAKRFAEAAGIDEIAINIELTLQAQEALDEVHTNPCAYDDFIERINQSLNSAFVTIEDSVEIAREKGLIALEQGRTVSL